MVPPDTSSQLVGRSQEKNILRTLLHKARQSQGQMALITGEAGIGKTRLLAFLTALAETNGYVVIRGECVEQDHDFPYAPIIDGLRTYFSGIESEDLQRILDPFQPEMIKLLPELALRLGESRTSTLLEPEAEKRRLFEVLVQVYQRLARPRLLLIFEDIHWCDSNSLEFFQTLTRRISRLPILVALSSRLTSPDSEAAVLPLYVDRAENAQAISLNPLAEAEIEDLIRLVLQTTDPIHPHLLENLTTLAQGNPLYTEQIVYMLLQNRQINLVNGTWMITSSSSMVDIPPSVIRTVERQTERLSDPARRTLQFAAVAGRQFDLAVLQRLTGFDDATFPPLVKDLINKRFLEEVSRDRFVFRHALLRQAIYDNLLIRERQTLHRSLLRIIEEKASPQTDVHLAELSYHAYQAEEWDAALLYGIRAGEYALALHSPRAAVEHFSHAVDAANRLGDRGSWDLFMQRGKALDDLGEFQRALDDYETALQLAEDDGNQSAIWQTLIALALLWASRDYRRAGEFCQRALQLAQSIEEPRLIGHSLNRLGNWHLNMGHPYEALGYHEQALAVFEELNDLPGKGETLDLLGMTNNQVLRLTASQEYYRAAIAIFRELDDRKMLASSLANLALSTLEPSLAEEAIATAHQIGWHSGEVYGCIVLGYVHSVHGRFTESLSHLHRSLDLAQAIDHIQWMAGAHVFYAFVYKDLLDLATAVDHAQQGIDLATEVGSHWFNDMGHGTLARILIQQGELEAAAGLLAHHPVPDRPAMQHMMLMLAEAELPLAHGQAETALSLIEEMHDVFVPPVDSGSADSLATIPYLIAQARAYALLDRRSEAVSILQRARRSSEALGLLPLLWQVESLLGQIVAHEDAAVAERHFQRARDCIDQITENIPEDMQELFRHSAARFFPSDTAPSTSSIAPHPLTPREMDVAREVARGKTNQQIANDLHITIKTVEAHLTRALSKLNLTSRTQIALWLVENDLIRPPE
jgi:DNA-binding NarL/FixJ family response regulator